jgi:competence protein ComEC
MVPLILHFFQQASLLAIPVNLVAIPWVSFVVVPTCLLGICLLAINKQLGQFCLQLAIYLIDILWRFLEQSAKYSFLIWHMALPEGLGCWITFLAGYISLLPKYICPPLIALSCWLPGLIPLPNTLSNKQLQLVVFDVGQGLATMVRTKHHTLIFDTGAKLSEVFDMGKGVIVPYLLKYGIKKIDILAISHGDNDHIGGAKSLLDSVPVTRIYTSVPERFSYISERIPVAYCQENMSWQWDGVQFKFLSPFRGAPFKGNNLSCVLKVTQGSHSLLLTGDIEKKAEEQLVKRHGNELAASILVAPHHGSKTSSSLNFIYKVMPAMTIFACGYLNSYHHPHPSTIKNYQRINVELYNTVKDGAITMTLVRDSDKVQVQKYRQQHQKLWHQLYSTNPAKP